MTTIDDLFPLNKWTVRERERYATVLLNKEVTVNTVLSKTDLSSIDKDIQARKRIIEQFMSIYGASFDTTFHTYWLGKQVVKSPLDLWMYQEIISETRPEIIIECGTNGSGSAYFFATVLSLLGLPDSKVITIDTERIPHLEVASNQIVYLYGSSLDADIIQQVHEHARGKRTMISLDSLHTYEQVIGELMAYGDLTSPGCYCVVEDTGSNIDGATFIEEIGGVGGGAAEAAAEFLHKRQGIFERDYFRERHFYSSNYGGFLKRIA